MIPAALPVTEAELADAARVAVWKVVRWASRRKMINGSIDVEDLCQVARADVYQRAGRYDRRRGVKPSTYLAESAFRVALRAFKESGWATLYAFSCDPERAMASEPYSLDYQMLEDGETCGDRLAAPAEDLLSRIAAGDVWRYVERLEPHQRRAVLAVHRDGRSPEDVATTEGVCEEAIRKRLRVSLRELRKMLEADGWNE